MKKFLIIIFLLLQFKVSFSFSNTSDLKLEHNKNAKNIEKKFKDDLNLIKKLSLVSCGLSGFQINFGFSSDNSVYKINKDYEYKTIFIGEIFKYRVKGSSIFWNNGRDFYQLDASNSSDINLYAKLSFPGNEVSKGSCIDVTYDQLLP